MGDRFAAARHQVRPVSLRNARNVVYYTANPQKKEAGRMTDKTLPVAFFDSGLGGISVLRETVHMLPHEDFL